MREQCDHIAYTTVQQLYTAVYVVKVRSGEGRGYNLDNQSLIGVPGSLLEEDVRGRMWSKSSLYNNLKSEMGCDGEKTVV